MKIEFDYVNYKNRGCFGEFKPEPRQWFFRVWHSESAWGGHYGITFLGLSIYLSIKK